MDSIGEKLLAAREARRLSIKDVAKDTNISPLYIDALEEEDFDKFPSETYTIGFLRAYAEYLKLDADEMIQAYKGYKIGESATPLEELTRPTRPSVMMLLSSFTMKYKNMLFIVSVSVAVLLVFWGVKALITSGVDVAGGDSIKNMKEEYNAKNHDSEIKNIQNIQLSNDTGFILVSKGEAVQFLVDSKEVVFFLKDIDVNTDSVIMEMFPSKKLEKIEIDKSRIIPIEGCPREVTFSLKALTESRAKIQVELSKKGVGGTAAATDIQSTPEEQQKVSANQVETMNNRNLKIVFEALFIQKSFIEIYLDGVQKQRGFIPEGTQERWEANEYIQAKIGNAGGVKAKINGRDYIFGRPGQVANKIITWKKDVNNPNLYHIEIKDW